MDDSGRCSTGGLPTGGSAVQSTPLPARHLLLVARGCLHTADVDAARHRLLDTASYSQPWVLFCPAPAASVDRAADSSPIPSWTRCQGRRSAWSVDHYSWPGRAGAAGQRWASGAGGCVLFSSKVAAALVYIAEPGAR